MSNASVIRPGLLVSIKSTVVGGVSYQRVDLDADNPAEEGQEVTRWETKRVIEDKDEHAAAVKCRSKALGLIRKCCNATSFGLLCPSDREGALDAAIAQARALVDAHNATSKHTRVGVYALKGRVASDDAEAARAITQEIGTLVTRMTAGIAAFDPEAIRAAANRARELSGMLSDEKQEKISAAIAQARAAARTITKNLETEGKAREVVMLDIQRGQIESARIAFLDLSGGEADPVDEPLPAVNQQRFADLELSGETDLVAACAEARERLKADGVEIDAAAWIAENRGESAAADDERPSTSTQDFALAGLRARQLDIEP